jgi:hypothetical protein
MKSTLIMGWFFFLAPVIMLNAMKEEATEPITKETPIAQLQTANNWQNLPTEIKYKILSFVPQTGNYRDWFNALLVSQEFKALAIDQHFLNDFAKRISEYAPDRAKSLLQEAVTHGDIFLTKALRQANDTLAKQAEEILFEAIRSKDRAKNLAIIKTLIMAGVPRNATDINKRTALHLALTFNALSIAQWLIAHHADISIKDSSGTTPLMLASKMGDVSLVRRLIRKGADINAQDESGQTALMGASKLGHEDIVKLLLRKGAERSIKDKNDKTAHTFALENKHKKIAALLQKPKTILPTISEEKLKSLLFFM